ncbi:class I SAM-dependent methyltransferase [Rhizorhabdus sp. FW153]|uniref:class I SAM-dependent methyltransferase n=1 Tax=Rhizorhabdus sp. FW153 TaxID=3400216 RepID=UPI003CFB872B
MSLTEKHISEVTAYIQRWDGHMGLYFADRVDVSGKRVLIVGSGWGTEVLWCLRRGAAYVAGIDPRSDERVFIERALEESGQKELATKFELHAATAHEIEDIGEFDLVLTNNTLEHVFGLSANLAAIAKFIPSKGARIYVLAGPLFHSSTGHHMPVGPWDHFRLSQSDLRAKVSPLQWGEYRDGLNGMTLTDFLHGVREAGLIVTELGVLLDPNINALPTLLSEIPSALKPMDLACQGVRCTLAFPHNI